MIAGGREPATPVAVVADGSMPTQRTLWSTLAEVAEDLERSALRPPAVVVVGGVVAVANPARYADAASGGDRAPAKV